jgi:hypothetical protein
MTTNATIYPEGVAWYIEVEAYESDGTTLITEIPRRYPVKFMESLNTPGNGEVSVPLDDELFLMYPDLLAMGNWIKFRMFTPLGTNKVVSAFHIRSRNTVWVDDNEWAGRVRTVSGPTAHFLLDDFMVKHQGVRQDFAGEERAFDWTALMGDWYNPADWETTYLHTPWIDPPTEARRRKPKGWSDQTAEWVWDEVDSAWEFWRSKDGAFTVDGPLQVEFQVSADEAYKFFVDGEEVIDRKQMETGFNKYQPKRLVLSDGPHQLAALIRAINSGVEGDGVDAWIMSCYNIQMDGSVGNDMLFHTDHTNWEVHKGLPAPGWTKALILIQCVTEAQDRGNESALMLTFGFDKDVDSDGVAWTDMISRLVTIGTSILDLQAQLSETGDFDIWINPETFTLEAWNFRGEDATGSVFLEAGVNLLNWTVDEQDEIKNDALGKYDGGWVDEDHAGSITAHGHREAMVSLGNITNQNDASHTLNRILDTAAGVDQKSGTADEIETDIDKKPTGGFIPTLGAVPFFDFDIGWLVSAPDAENSPAAHRLISCAVSEDEEGVLSFDPDLIPWSA